jgi:F-box protein 11
MDVIVSAKRGVSLMSEEKKSFWTTLPGLITAFAGLLGSVVTLMNIISPSVPLTAELTAIPLEINAGESCTLSWNVAGGTKDTKVTIDQRIGEVALSGTQKVQPRESTTFKLTASGGKAKPVTATAYVIVKTQSQETVGIGKQPQPSAEVAAEQPAGYTAGYDLVVDQMRRGDYENIADAINAAKAGDKILVKAGVYHESLIIDKPLEIVGNGSLGEVIIRGVDRSAIAVRTAAVRISNLMIRQDNGIGSYAIDISEGSPTIENCDVASDSLACIAIHSGADPIVRGNVIHDGAQGGIYIYSGGRGIIERNDIHGNALSGVEIKEESNPSLTNNRIHDGRMAGVMILDNSEGTLNGNDIYGNSGNGVYIFNQSNPSLKENRIHDNDAAGVYLNEKSRGAITENDIFGNKRSGIEISNSSDPVVNDNRIHDSRGCGVLVRDLSMGSFAGNDIYSNDFAGVGVCKGSNPTMTDNTFRDGKSAGILIYDGGLGSFENNIIRENSACGVEIRVKSTASIKDSKINNNKDYGIWIHDKSSATITNNDLTGNKKDIEISKDSSTEMSRNILDK